jgi:hypothetical protein
MGKAKNDWYEPVKKLIRISKHHPMGSSIQFDAIHTAMEEVNTEIFNEPQGNLKFYAINSYLVNETKTYDGVALELHYSASVIQGWVSDYINRVGKKAGF